MRFLNWLLAVVSVGLGLAVASIAADLGHGLLNLPRPLVSLPVALGAAWGIYSGLYRVTFGQVGGAE